MKHLGTIDVAIVLGSGLSDLFGERAAFTRISYEELALPFARLAGHTGEVLVTTWHGKRVVMFAGRAHAYQGFNAREITRNIDIAAESGARTVLLTNAAGALNETFKPGDLMIIADHINLSGLNPIIGSGLADPFINMADAYSPRLRRLAAEIDPQLHEGVYAGMLGPTYETAAEARYLRTIGADAVGMSTVLETIAARAHGLEVFGISLITNVVAAPQTSHTDVTTAATHAAPRLATLLDALIAQF
ncbi:MAG TPA: purine-nucleoside phosphorylase [Candidatus Baltobacteraceae bacterium]|nr:purine-nucleoside phosphorylase [Candidatus Baltobacteraceae bacterium]